MTFNLGAKSIGEMESMILGDIAASHGLLSDAFNQWVPASGVNEGGADFLIEILTYGERLRNHEATSLYADFVIQHSDPEKIRKYDELVKIYNAELPEIKKTSNYARANEIGQEAMSLLAG